MKLFFLFCWILVLLAGRLALADQTATILGRITDPSSASIAGAAITVRNDATGIERTTVSTASGDFEVSLLPISGTYTLTVSGKGF
jgi:Carboxypeptidase regulatory-like domain